MKTKRNLFLLTLILCVGPALAGPAFAAPVLGAAAVQNASLCVGENLNPIFAPDGQSAGADLFGPQATNMQGAPVCQVTCVTSACSSNSECTAAPNGHCNFACPGVGCCVYR